MPKNSCNAPFSRAQLPPPLKSMGRKSANALMRISPSTSGTLHSNGKTRVQYHPFLLDQLPTEPLVVLANNLNFDDAKNFRQISKKFHAAEKMARNSRKCFSLNLLHYAFPNAHKDWTELRRNDHGIGILEVQTAIRKVFRSLPFGTITEVDLSGFSTFSMTYFLDLLQAIYPKSLFANVRKLNIGNCVMEWRDVELLASFMPDLLSIQISNRCIVLPLQSPNTTSINNNNSNDKKINTSAELSAEERSHLESIVVNFPSLIAQHNHRQRVQQHVRLATAPAPISSRVTRKRRSRLSATTSHPRVVMATQQLDDNESCRPSVLRLVSLLTKLFIKLELICLQ